GVVADSYSRRLSLIIGTFVMAAAYLLEGSVPWLGGVLPFFWGVVVAEVIRGIGWTFMSGAQQAWITDEVGSDRVGTLFMRGAKFSRFFSLAGIPLSVGLANLGLNLPFLVGGALHLGVAIFMLFKMREHGFRPEPRGNRPAWQALTTTFREGIGAVRGRPVLMALLAVTVITGASSEGVARLWEAHFLITLRLEEVSRLTPATWFGILSAVSALLGIAAAHVSEKRIDLSRPRQVTIALMVSTAVRMLCILVLAGAPGLGWAVAAVVVMPIVGAVYGPLFDTWVNQQAESRTRATVLSIIGQMDAVGQSGGGPVVGWVGTRFSLRAALALSGALLLPALGVYGRTLRPLPLQGAGHEAPHVVLAHDHVDQQGG
ncbi:MAG: MFS transporter, partial [Bacillota bacterium]